MTAAERRKLTQDLMRALTTVIATKRGGAVIALAADLDAVLYGLDDRKRRRLLAAVYSVLTAVAPHPDIKQVLNTDRISADEKVRCLSVVLTLGTPRQRAPECERAVAELDLLMRELWAAAAARRVTREQLLAWYARATAVREALA